MVMRVKGAAKPSGTNDLKQPTEEQFRRLFCRTVLSHKSQAFVMTCFYAQPETISWEI